MPRAFFTEQSTRLPSGRTVEVTVARETGEPLRVVATTTGPRPAVILDMPWHDLQAIAGAANRAIHQHGQEQRQQRQQGAAAAVAS